MREYKQRTGMDGHMDDEEDDLGVGVGVGH